MIAKIVWYVLLSGILLSASLLGGVYFYQDEIIQRFLTEANRYMATAVRVKKISLTSFEHFPQLSVSLDQVHIAGTLPYQEGAHPPLAEAERLDFTFNLWQLLQGEYVIDEVWLQNARIYLHVAAEGNNYAIFQSPQLQTGSTASLRFALRHITLQQVDITYTDEPARQKHQLWTKYADATLQAVAEQYDISLQGDFICQGLEVQHDTYFKEKTLSLKALLRYDYPQRHLSIHPSTLYIGQGAFLLQGTVDHAQKVRVDLSAEGSHTDAQTLLSLLPQRFSREFSAYRSEGDMYFQGKVSGEISEKQNPGVEIAFGCRKASLYHPQYRKKLEQLSLQGSFTNGPGQNLSTSELKLQQVEALLDGRPISGELIIRDFQRYFLSCRAKALLDINSLLAFYPIPEIHTASGLLKADFSVSGYLKDMQNVHAYRQQRVKSAGDITLQQIKLQLLHTDLPLHAWNGNFIFKNNDLALNNLSGYLGNSHFHLNGLFRNALSYLLTSHQYIQVEADLRSDLIDMDELLSDRLSMQVSSRQDMDRAAASNWQATAEKQPYQFSIDPRLLIDFDYTINRLKFRRLRSRNLQGTLSIQNSIATLPRLSVEVAGGNIRASSRINARKPDHIQVESSLQLQHLYLDSIFYVFEEFGQDFMTSHHLKGQVYADMEWHMRFDKNLHLDYPSLQVKALTTLKNGELNNFEPMQRLSRFVAESDLSRLRFAEMSNHIRIARQTIFIPRMRVSNNVTDMSVQGTHTFLNHIDYRFEVPMRSFSLRSAAARERSAQRAQSFGDTAPDDAKPTLLFLKAQGTVDDYKISYDMGAAQDKFRENLREEKQELQQTLRTKGRKDKTKVKLQEEDYFDF